MDSGTLSQSPFVVLTFIAAPALLTNSTCVLALSTINRMLRTRDTMHQLLVESRALAPHDPDAAHMIEHVNRVEAQATLLLSALHTIYLALGAFSGATLVTLVGAAAGPLVGARWYNGLAILGVGLGAIGVTCLIISSIRLFRATQISLVNVREEAKLIRAQHPMNG